MEEGRMRPLLFCGGGGGLGYMTSYTEFMLVIPRGPCFNSNRRSISNKNSQSTIDCIIRQDWQQRETSLASREEKTTAVSCGLYWTFNTYLHFFQKNYLVKWIIIKLFTALTATTLLWGGYFLKSSNFPSVSF